MREIIAAFERSQEGHELAQRLKRVWPIIKQALLASVSQPQADLTERARATAYEWLRTRPVVGMGPELTALLAAFAQSERKAAAAKARRAATLNRTVAEQIAAEIVSIMETYDQQEAERGYVDTPGGLEHMGDVWRLLGGWRDRLASPAPKEETR